VARRAPTAGNTQQVHWILVSGTAKVRALAEEAINWMRISDDPLGIVALWAEGNARVLWPHDTDSAFLLP
jgi:nitroreductase